MSFEPEFATCDLCDDNMETVQVLPPIFRNYGKKTTFGGEVVTVKCLEDNSRVKETLATPGAGKVLVVDGEASMRCALMGDLIAQNACDNRWEGVIVYGCIRDSDVIAEINLGAQAIATIPMKSVRKGQGTVGDTLEIEGISIKPGDYIYADNDGIIVSATPLV